MDLTGLPENMEEIKYNGPDNAVGLAVVMLISLTGDTLEYVGTMDVTTFPNAHQPVEEPLVYRRRGAPPEADHAHLALACFSSRGDGSPIWRALMAEETGDGGFKPHLCAQALALAGFFGDDEQDLLDSLGVSKADTIQA